MPVGRRALWFLLGLSIAACGGRSPGLEGDDTPATRVVPADDPDRGYRIEAGGRTFATFDLPVLGDLGAPQIAVDDAGDGWVRVGLRWQLDRPVQQDDLAVEIALGFEPDFHWMPHLAPEGGYVAAQHVFRSPAVIVAKGASVLAVVPDLDLVGQRAVAPWYLDYDAPTGRAFVGLSRTTIPTHVLYQKSPGMTLEPGALDLAFFAAAYEDRGDPINPINPWRRVARFLWERWARPLYNAGEPNRVPMARYVERTYDWAFESWADAVWQEFEIDGTRVGAPQFIVNVTQSPNYPGEWEQREFLSIWNQAWFSSLRSASGVMRWARRTGSADLEAKATLTKALALAAPMRDGIFPSVIRTDNDSVTIAGETYRRPRDWDEAYWTNSNRSPENFGVSTDWYHLLDASWTALLMLRWHAELEPDPELLDYARTYADRLLTLQEPNGFFPAWLHPETLEPSAVLSDSPETSMSVTFLLKLAELTGEARYRAAALRGMDAVLDGPVRDGR